MLGSIAVALLPLLLCGTERWSVKVLADPGASDLVLAPRSVSIAQINGMTPGCASGQTPRTAAESRLVRVVGKVQLVKRETDGDLHIVLVDPAGNTVIVESPSVQCVQSAHSHFHTALRQARFKAEHLVKGMTVTVQGPLFADFNHGQTGRSRSCYEVHPILFIDLPLPLPR